MYGCRLWHVGVDVVLLYCDVSSAVGNYFTYSYVAGGWSSAGGMRASGLMCSLCFLPDRRRADREERIQKSTMIQARPPPTRSLV
jgi:hypothetical protein